MKNQITVVMPKKSFWQNIKDAWNEPKPTDEEIKVSKMMALLFNEQSTEQVVDTLNLLDEKVKTKLQQIKQQAETDRFVTDFYLGTSIKQTLKV